MHIFAASLQKVGAGFNLKHLHDVANASDGANKFCA